MAPAVWGSGAGQAGSGSWLPLGTRAGCGGGPGRGTKHGMSPVRLRAFLCPDVRAAPRPRGWLSACLEPVLQTARRLLPRSRRSRSRSRSLLAGTGNGGGRRRWGSPLWTTSRVRFPAHATRHPLLAPQRQLRATLPLSHLQSTWPKPPLLLSGGPPTPHPVPAPAARSLPPPWLARPGDKTPPAREPRAPPPPPPPHPNPTCK